jgi:molybdopterin-guanine dinucleotide biosynthesis protein A
MKVAGIILCGGQSKRMGRSKASLPFGTETMLSRVVRILSSAVEAIVVVAAADQEIPNLPTSVRIIRDERPGRGPLQGLATGLSALAGSADLAYVSSCDVPFLKPEFICRIIELLGDAEACVPELEGRRHSLAGIYRVSVLPKVKEMLEEGELRFSSLLDRVRTRLVDAASLTEVDPELRSLRNLNTPGEYEAALREFQL